jgi:hypothetical protein
MKAIANVHRPTLLTLLVLVLLVTGLGMLTPKPAQSVCCDGWEIDITYYCDSAKTIWCGECYTDCSGFQTCDGTKTAYYTRTRTCCGPCLP